MQFKIKKTCKLAKSFITYYYNVILMFISKIINEIIELLQYTTKYLFLLIGKETAMIYFLLLLIIYKNAILKID